MSYILRGLGVLIFIGLFTAGLARISDGPIGPVAGGALLTGRWIDTEDLDWSFAADTDTVEFQLLDPERSRTVWVVYYGGKLYIPCGVPNFTLWKQWPHEAVADGRAVIRSDGKRYAVSLVKSEDERERTAVLDLVSEKYDSTVPEGEDLTDLVWVFRLEPREHDEV